MVHMYVVRTRVPLVHVYHGTRVPCGMAILVRVPLVRAPAPFGTCVVHTFATVVWHTRVPWYTCTIIMVVSIAGAAVPVQDGIHVLIEGDVGH